MIGHPKYVRGDIVCFRIDNKKLTGTICIIDEYGTFFRDDDVYYDIMVERTPVNMFYKHIPETAIDEKMGEGDPNLL